MARVRLDRQCFFEGESGGGTQCVDRWWDNVTGEELSFQQAQALDPVGVLQEDPVDDDRHGSLVSRFIGGALPVAAAVLGVAGAVNFLSGALGSAADVGAAGLADDAFELASATPVGEALVEDYGFGDTLSFSDQDFSSEFSEAVYMDDEFSLADYGGDILGDSGMVQTGGLGAVVSGARTLGSVLGLGGAARAGVGRIAGAAARFTINGVSTTGRQLWSAIRKYGPHAVAAGVGMSAADLLAVAFAQDPTMGAKRRRTRGISGRDVRTTRRVVGFVTKISQQIGCVRRPSFKSRKSCP